ncbi:hypothetical protein [Bradyrhizobium sp.]|uniref:hypothetical protein n=1 Tax=Bradyrhizobium sp. TaxID=376 RepID=UPI00345A111D
MIDRGFGGVLSLGALVAMTLALAGCSTSIADLPVGSTADTPAPHEPNGYLPVHDLPPDREEQVIPPAERAKIQAELLKARDHQATAAAPTATAPTPPAAANKDAGPPKQTRRAKPPPGESRAED